jgi:beta-N-acetylhexosaminidase
MAACGGGAARHGKDSGAHGGLRGGLLAVLCLMLATLGACGTPAAAGQGHHGSATPTPTLGSWSGRATGPVYDYRTAYINSIMARMTLDQELGQLFIVNYPYADANHPDVAQMFGQMDAGGVILYKASNIFTLAQTQALTRGLQAHASIPLIITADEEGGGDEQDDQIFGSHPSEADIGATGNPAVAAQNGARLATELRTMGFNADFAPIVDVEAPYRNWLRAYGHSADLVTTMGMAEMDAMQANGIMATLKHFPGLGGATVNPHFGLPVINFSKTYLEQHDWVPYRALMSHHPAMIMTTDLLMPALDPTTPAELSYPIVTGILRNEIGYDGVVVTDALYMEGISKHYTMAQAVVLAIKAGNDMVEGIFDVYELREMVAALHAAVRSGQLTRARVDQSVRRILQLKLRFGLLKLPPTGGQRDVAAAMPDAPGTPSGMMSGLALVPEPRRPRGALAA